MTTKQKNKAQRLEEAINYMADIVIEGYIEEHIKHDPREQRCLERHWSRILNALKRSRVDWIERYLD